MMKNEMKTNNKTVLLAILAVFAMVAAGAAVVISTDGVDAAPAADHLVEDSELVTDLTAYEAQATVADKMLFLKDAASIAVPADGEINIYVSSGKTVTLTGVAGSTAIVWVNAVKSTSTAAAATILVGSDIEHEAGEVDYKLKVTLKATTDSVTIKATLGTKGTTAANAGTYSSFTVSGTAVTAGDLVQYTAPGSVVGDPGAKAGTATVADSGVLDVVTAGAANISAKTEKVTGANTAFAGSVQKSYTFDGAADVGTFTINNLAGAYTGKIVYTYGENRTVLNFDAITFNAGDPFVLTIAAGNAPKIDGAVADDDKGTISLTSGLATRNDVGDFAANLNAVVEKTTATKLNAQIIDGTSVYNTVNGTIIQATSVAMDGDNIVVAANNTLIIPEGVTVAIDANTTIEGTVKLFGNLVDKGAHTHTASGTIFIGPAAYTDFTGVAAGDLQNMADDGTQTELGGEIKQDTSMGDIVIKAGGLTINEGSTLTVNGDLGLNGQKLTVKGQLVVNGSIYSTNNVTAATDVIIIATTGAVTVSGDFAVNTVIGLDLGDASLDLTVVGVNGIEYGYATVGEAKVATFNGTLSANTKANEKVVPKITVETDVVVDDSLTIGTGVIVSVANGASVAVNGGDLVVKNGFLLGTSDEPLYVNNGGSVEITGVVKEMFICAYTGIINTTHKGIATADNVVAVPFVDIEAGVSYTYASGLTIAVGQEKVDKETFQRAYISGTVTKVKVETTATAFLGADDAMYTIALSGELYVAEDDTLTVGGTDAVLDYDGVADPVIAALTSITVEGEIVTSEANKLGAAQYFGGHYTILVEAASVHHYEALEDALISIDYAENKKVDARIAEIDFDITILDGQTLNFASEASIKSTATVTVEANGVISGVAFTHVYGVLYQVYGGKVPTPGDFAAKTTTAAGDNIYAGLIPAIALATPGSTVTVTEGTANGNLVVSNEVTVVVTDQITITGDLTIDEDSALVGGIIEFDDEKGTTATKHNIAVKGLLDVTDGSIKCADGDTVVATVTGALGVVNENVLSGGTSYFAETINGAVFADDDGVVLTTIDQALLGAPLVEADDITIFGTVSYPGDLTVSDVTVKFKDANAKLVLGNVVLDDATVDIANGTFSGNVKVAGSAVDLSTVKGTLKIAGDSKKESMTLSGNVTEGYVIVDEGTVILNGVNITSPGENITVFIVAAGADADVTTAATTVDDDKVAFTVNGTVDVYNGGTLNLTSGTIINAGTMTAFKGTTAGTINIGSLVNLGTLANIDGTINVNANSHKAADGTITGLIVGMEMNGVGAANGTVAGNLTTAHQILVFAGADVDDMTINAVGDVDAAKVTLFYINDTPYMCIYGTGGALDEDILSIPSYEIPGFDVPADIDTLAGWGLPAGAMVGNPAIAGAEIVKAEVGVKMSWDTGLSLYVDNVRVTSTAAIDNPLSVGTHTVMVKVNPGYKYADGTSATVTFDGKAITGLMVFEITPEMEGKAPVLSATATLVVDQPDIPEQEKEDNSMIMILLGVLVVMVVILAIVTVIRMMRS